MSKTALSLVGFRKYGDPYVGILLQRLNPEVVFPDQGADLRLPSAGDLLDFDPRLGGQALPQGEETAALIAVYHERRKPRLT